MFLIGLTAGGFTVAIIGGTLFVNFELRQGDICHNLQVLTQHK